MKGPLHDQRGFTLIELLTVIAILGVVSGLALNSFYQYRSDAAIASAESAAANGVLAMEATLNTPDRVFPAVLEYAQGTQGPISDPTVARVLPGMQVPPKVKMRFSFDPDCQDASCILFSVQMNHCQGSEFIRRVRMGDGVETTLQLAGSGCR